MQKEYELEKLFSNFTKELSSNLEDYLMNYYSANGRRMSVSKEQLQALFPLLTAAMEEGVYKVSDRYVTQVKNLVADELVLSSKTSK